MPVIQALEASSRESKSSNPVVLAMFAKQKPTDGELLEFKDGILASTQPDGIPKGTPCPVLLASNEGFQLKRFGSLHTSKVQSENCQDSECVPGQIQNAFPVRFKIRFQTDSESLT